MRLFTHGLILGPSLAAAAPIGPLVHRANQTAVICSTLDKAFPGQIQLPGSSNYTAETTSMLNLIIIQYYDFLIPQGLNVVGGRVWPVGSVLLLGGGISYFSYKQGWASNNVLNFELVTGKGEVLQVKKKTYPDLFRTLKDGGNNYGIVTRYDTKTFSQGRVFGGTIAYKPENTQDYLDAYQTWINPGGGVEDDDSAVMPNVN